MEDDLKKNENGRRPQKKMKIEDDIKMEDGRRSKKMEDDLKQKLLKTTSITIYKINLNWL